MNRTIQRMIRGALLGVLLPSALLLAGCSHDEAPTPAGEAVTFTARIAAAGPQATRTANGGDSWVTGDAVGVLMLTAGGDISASGDVLAANAAYAVTNAATGALSGGPIYYPQSGSVDFVAYYPYGSPTGGTLAITVAGQTTEAAQNALDVLYARTQGVARTKTAVGLTFNHVLSKVTFNIKAGAGIAAGDVSSLAAGSIVFGGMPAAATLHLQDGTLTAGATAAFSPLKAATPTATFDATFTALTVPQPTGGAGRTAVFTVGGNEYTWNIPDTEAFAAVGHYVYPVTVSRTGIIVGTPSIADWTTRDNGSGTATEIGVRIPAGTFTMGQDGVATPVHEVTLTEDFYMSRYEITDSQYADFLNAVGVPKAGVNEIVSWDVAGFGQQPLFRINQWWTPQWNDAEERWVASIGNVPMIYVSWYGAKAYADWVGGALPTEAQWEYACRAGSTTAYSYGDAANDDYMWYGLNSGNGPGGVGQKLPNDWGLYDMHGNVYEWCADLHGDYPADPATDPVGPASGSNRVLRGGDYANTAYVCCSAARYYHAPGNPQDNFGFRVVFTLP